MKVIMKKTVVWIIGLALLSGMILYFPLVAKAETSGDYEYAVLEDGSAEITKYNGSDTVAEVPAEIAGHQVKNIGRYAFLNCVNLSSVELPEGLTNIERYAFISSGLTSITIPEGVTVINQHTFESCASLTSIELPEGLTSIGIAAFLNCRSLSSIELPKGVTSIRFQAFNNTGLTDVYYQGTEEDQAKIEIAEGNDTLLSATWHYDSETEPDPVPADDHEHTLVKTEAVAATCETDGNIVYWTCSGCGKIFADVAGTKEVTKEATVEMALGHNWGEWKTVEEATTTKEGLEERICSRDASHKQTRSIPKQNIPDQNKKEGWRYENNGWYYYKNNASLKGWIYDGAWYYLDQGTGTMRTGWLYDGGSWYYLNRSGAMVTGWQYINNVWYYLKTDGAMATNEWCEGYWLNGDGSWTYPYYGQWHLDSVGWWFGDNSGWYARNGISRISGVDYRFNASGYWVQ